MIMLPRVKINPNQSKIRKSSKVINPIQNSKTLRKRKKKKKSKSMRKRKSKLSYLAR